jgi:hypothetical protein
MMLPPFGAYELPYPKSCHVYLNGTQSIPSGVWTVVSINTGLWDTYGLYTGGASQYITIPEDGLYFINSKIATTVVINSYIALALYANAALVVFKMGAPNPYHVTHVMLSYMYMFNKSDLLDIRVLWGGSGNIAIGQTGSDCFMQVLKLPYITKGF